MRPGPSIEGDRLCRDRPIAKPVRLYCDFAVGAVFHDRLNGPRRAEWELVSMEGCEMEVPDPERRRAANAALRDSIEEVCRHYAPSGARVEDCWEVREAGDGAVLRVFLAGPMRGSWTDAATGARGDALDLVARLCGLDAAGALAEAEQFLGRNAVKPEREAEDAGGGQMGLFGALPESRKRKRPARRSGKARNAGPS